MRRIIIECILPFIISLTAVYYFAFDEHVNNFLFKNTSIKNYVKPAFRCIENFHNDTAYEEQFLKSGDTNEVIFILGSSELPVNTIAIPYNFISDHFKTKLKGVGHAGNQCFSIYSQLLANENRLKDAPIVIVLSPGWFHSDNAKGTNSSVFLEFNSPRFLNAIFQNDSVPIFKQYETERISNFFDVIVAPDLILKLFYFEKQLSKSFLHKCIYFPVIAIDNILNNLKSELLKRNHKKQNTNAIVRKPIIPESATFNWDSLFLAGKQEQIKKSTNNKWYIDNDYYSKNINGQKRTILLVNDENNQELKDFKMLVKLLKTKKANASFIIFPINPFCYTNSNELTPLINSLQAEIDKNNFPCLNLWNADSTKFDIGILRDVAHVGNYGWYKADKFIIETYKLAK
jgi:D-alanine transfer protein